MITNEALETLIEHIRAGVQPVTLHQTPMRNTVLVPLGPDGRTDIKFIDRERGHLAPLRKRGEVIAHDIPGFMHIIRLNRDAGAATIYVNREPDNPKITAILNDNNMKGPGWRDLRVELALRQTPQWIKWRRIDGKMLPQAEFAEFLEDNLADINDPPGAAALEIATHLEATRSATFKSAIRLSSGAVQLQNLEDIDAKVGAGRIEVPTTFTLAIAPIAYSAPFLVTARFRYRIQDGRLLLGLKLGRVEDIMAGVVDDLVANINAHIAGDETLSHVGVINGAAPAPTPPA